MRCSCQFIRSLHSASGHTGLARPEHVHRIALLLAWPCSTLKHATSALPTQCHVNHLVKSHVCVIGSHRRGASRWRACLGGPSRLDNSHSSAAPADFKTYDDLTQVCLAVELGKGLCRLAAMARQTGTCTAAGRPALAAVHHSLGRRALSGRIKCQRLAVLAHYAARCAIRSSTECVHPRHASE